MRIKDFSAQFGISAYDLLIAIKQQKQGTYDENTVLSENQIAFLKSQFRISETSRIFKHGLSAKDVIVVQDMTVGDLAVHLKCAVTDLIVQFLRKGIFANKNQVVKKEQIVGLLKDLGISYEFVKHDTDALLEKFIEAKTSTGSEVRLPTVAVVGHVDHGKTSLLDYIRKARVAAAEKGGITQQVAAYEVTTKHGNLVFIDTPGHEAFSLMRERGVLLADIVVLLVALDDGIKPQTIESIKVIKNFGATVVVALNKVDKVASDRIDIVKRQLAEQDLLPDDWGGQTPCIAVSAKTGQGVDELLEMIRLQADLLDLKTDSSGLARGFVLESKMEHGRGAVATLILQRGTLSRGSYFVCGSTSGKVSSIMNYIGKALPSIGPSVPAQVAGFSSLPQPGDVFEAVADAAIVKKHQKALNFNNVDSAKHISVEAEQGVGGVKVILKANTLLSREALLSSISKLNIGRVEQLRVIDVGVGDISENNLELALTAGAIVYGLGVKVAKDAAHLIKKGVVVKTFDIIYQLIDDAEKALIASRIKKVQQKILGVARVKAMFKIKTYGLIAGAAVESGTLHQSGRVKILRNNVQVGHGIIKTLQKDRNKHTSVSEGSDCAFAVDNFDGWMIGDVVQEYVEELV